MNAIHATARKAHRRRLLSRFVRALGRTMTIAAAATVGLVIADRLFSLEWNAWLVASAPALVALLGAMAITLRRRESLLAAAAHVDHSLQLQDRLGSAFALEQESPDDPFTTLAIEDAQRVAGKTRVRDATPILFDRTWIAWPIVGSLAVASAIFVPALDLAHREADKSQQAEKTAMREEARQEIEDVQKTRTPDDTQTADLATPTDLEILETLKEQLASGEVDPDEARASAASALDREADTLEKSASQADAQSQALRNAMDGVNAVDSPGEPSPLTEALSEGDFDAAQKLLEAQRQLLDTLDQREREKLAEELDQVADALERSPADESPDQVESPAVKDLRTLGMDESDIEEIQNENDPEKVRQKLREQGVDEPTVERIADELDQERQEKESQEQAHKDADELRQSLRDAADETRQDPDESNTNENDSRDGQDATDQLDPTKADPSEPEPPQSDTSQPNSDKQTNDTKSQKKQGQPAGQPDPNKPDSAPADSPSDAGEKQPSSGSQPDQGEPTPQATPGNAPDKNAPPKDGATPGSADTPNKTPGGSPDASPDGDKGYERAKRLLKKFSDRQQQSKDKRRSAENARKQARKLLDHMSPAQQEQLKRWAKELSREKNTPRPAPAPNEFAHTPVDMRQPSDSPQRTIAQWFDPNTADRDPSGVSHRRVDQQLRQAADGAQRAIEEQNVNRRYNEIIKRYFKSAEKSAARPKSTPAPANSDKKKSGS